MWNVGLSPAGLVTVLTVKCHSGKDHEVVSGHLTGRNSSSGLIYVVPAAGVGTFINVLFHSNPGECCVVSSFIYVPLWAGCPKGESFYISTIGQCSLTVSVPSLIRPKYGL